MMLEIKDSCRYIESAMSIRFMMLTMVVAYVVYLLVFQDIEPVYIILYSMVVSAHVSTMALLINRSNKVAVHNRAVASRLLQLYARLETLPVVFLIKLQTNIFSLLNFTSGYRLRDGSLVDSTGYFMVYSF